MATSTKGFFGINVHLGSAASSYSTTTTAQYIALLKNLGATSIRTNIASAGKADAVFDQIKAITDAGIDVIVVLDQAPNLTTSSASNQTAGAANGNAIASRLVGSGVKRIECSNEFDFNTKINGLNPRGFTADGASVDDFVDAKFECWRGWLLGQVSAVKSYGFSASYASGNAFPQIAFNMMRKGMDVTGAITKTPVPLDNWIGCHFYDTQGNPLSFTARSRTGNADIVNSLAELKALSPSPDLYITEWGAKTPDASQASFLSARQKVFFDNRDLYNIKGTYWYCLYADLTDSGTGSIFGVNPLNYGMIQADGQTWKDAANSFKAFTAANQSLPEAPPPVQQGNVIMAYNALPQSAYDALGAMGYTGTVQDRQSAFWKNTAVQRSPVILANTNVASSTTGSVTDNPLQTVIMAGNTMGPNSSLRITTLWSYPNNANTKTIRIKVGSALIVQSSFTTTGVFMAEVWFRNRGSQASQVWVGGGNSGLGTGGGPLGTSTVDTSVDQTIVFSGQNGVGSDTIVLESFLIELIN